MGAGRKSAAPDNGQREKRDSSGPGGEMPRQRAVCPTLFQQQLEKGGARITFAIGGAEGFSEEVKKSYPLISLSPLTFTHQMTRLILIEQIYRATEILKGSKYHK